MTKNCLLAVALVSLALAVGCAKGGNGIVPPPIVISVAPPSDQSALAIYATQSLTITATVTGTTSTAVTWALSGTSCSGSACGTLTPVTPATTPATATYVAPAAAIPPVDVTITATLVSDTTKTGTLTMRIVPVTVYVTPTTVNVGAGLVQQFTAVGIPDRSPQTFTWSCTPAGSCGNLVQDPNFSGLAGYTAPASGSPTISAAWGSPPTGPPTSVVGQSAVQVVPSRLPSGAYAFRFSGYDKSSNPVAAAGSISVGAGGVITGGVEDVLTAGTPTQYAITSGSYKPINSDNNLGTLTLVAAGGPTSFTAVLSSLFAVAKPPVSDPSGIMRMIESDGNGTGSGVLQASASSFNSGPQTFAFGFTGVDSLGNRIGYAGLLPMTPSSKTAGAIAGGLLDVNDNGNTTICGTPPCSVTGTYSAGANGLWTMHLFFGAMTLDFDFFVAGGQTGSQSDLLTLYAVSTDTTYKALSGTMVYQLPLKTSTCAAPCYNNAAFKGTSVSNLTGANANVSLTLGTTDGSSSGTGGTGGFFGQFDQNNNGTILSAASFPAASQTTSPYTYVATNNNTGRYIFYMMGDPTQTTPVPPIPFVLYAIGANRGFLLDQSSTAVMTGRMDPQPAKPNYAPSELPGTFAAATIGNSDSSTVPPVVQNLLLTSNSVPPPVYSVTGTQDGSQPLVGTYFVTSPGPGTIVLTTPSPTATSVIYAIDVDKTTSAILDFMMMGTCTVVAPATTCTSGPPSSIMFAQQ